MTQRIFILVCFLHVLTATGQQDSSGTWIVKGGLQDHAKLWSAPLRIKPRHLAVIVPLAGATATAIYYDEIIYDKTVSFKANRPWTEQVSSRLTYVGDGITTLGIGTAFYLTGRIIRNEKATQTGSLCYQALIHSSIITTIGKIGFSRKRPVSGYGTDWQPDGVSVWHFFPNYLKSFQGEPMSNYSSFPSGHTTAAWSVATVIAKQYQNTIWVPILAYSTATAVGVTRMILEKHWSSDVLVGAIIGYGVGHYLYKNRNNTKWLLLPVSSGKNFALTGIYKL